MYMHKYTHISNQKVFGADDRDLLGMNDANSLITLHAITL